MFGIYVHIPYCIQRCHYCDFSTFTADQIPSADKYIKLVLHELKSRRKDVPYTHLDTIYFGGGTPSLIDPALLKSVIEGIRETGFTFAKDIEITIEINPGTLTLPRLDSYLKMGINRFSVGAQTFKDSLLKMCGREHNAQQTRELLTELSRQKLNYSFDLLFALPGQSMQDLQADLEQVSQFSPPHLSAYCLTVPPEHMMSKGRAHDDVQVEMFAEIESAMTALGLNKYEISNFAKPGYESRHNLLYWNDSSFWGLGLSAHSYLSQPNWGSRFWNPKTYDGYEKSLVSSEIFQLPKNQIEHLQVWESLTDFCHTALRCSTGLSTAAVQKKFGDTLRHQVEARLQPLLLRELVSSQEDHYSLTSRGQLLSNKVFLELAFSESDLKIS